jgi:hypothetical protein
MSIGHEVVRLCAARIVIQLLRLETLADQEQPEVRIG